MATGRGQALASFRMGLEKVQQASIRIPPNRSNSQNARTKMSSDSTKKKRHGTFRKNPQKSESNEPAIKFKIPASRSQNHFESAVWYKMFLSKSENTKKWKPRQTEEVADDLNTATIREKPEGYWKRLYFRKMAGYNENKWRRQLKVINPYTGLPSQTEQVLRNLNVTWELTLTDKRGWESTFQQSHTYFSDSSMTVCWSNSTWPPFCKLSKLQLHGVKQVALDCPTVNKPGWRSLIARHDLNDIRERSRVIGSDKLVNLLHLAPGLIIGLWRGNGSIAVVMMNLHFHKLVERSLLGSSICAYTVPEDRPPFDDVDPEYGLHGYTVHILLHNTVKHIMSGHFSQLFCRTDKIRDRHIQLKAIDKSDLSQHTPSPGKSACPGRLKNCCMMTLTVLDEAQNPFWCVSAPVTVLLSKLESTSYNYEGENFFIKYQDSEGRVKIELVWLEEQEQFFLTSLVIYIATTKVNKHFGREY